MPLGFIIIIIILKKHKNHNSMSSAYSIQSRNTDEIQQPAL